MFCASWQMGIGDRGRSCVRRAIRKPLRGEPYVCPPRRPSAMGECLHILDDMRSDLGWYGSRVAMEGREALACKGDGRHDERLNVGL